jgi:hypothetical protein
MALERRAATTSFRIQGTVVATSPAGATGGLQFNPNATPTGTTLFLPNTVVPSSSTSFPSSSTAVVAAPSLPVASSPPDPQPQGLSHTATIIVIASCSSAFAILSLIIAIVFYRAARRKKEPKERVRKVNELWRDSAATGGNGFYNEPRYSHSQEWDTKEAFSAHNEPPILPPLDQGRSFLTIKSSQTLLDGRTSQASPELQHDDSGSYLRSIYSSYDTNSIGSQSQLKRQESLSKQKSKTPRELIAMEKLIQALDLSAEEEIERQRKAGNGPAHHRGSSYMPSFPLPPPEVFRAALGGGDDEGHGRI